MPRRVPLIIAVAIVSAYAASASYAITQYRIEYIDPPATLEPYQFLMTVGGLNNLGDVAFRYERSIRISETGSRGVTDSFIATQTGVQAIPQIGGDLVHVSDLTDAGLAVGIAASADTYEPYPHADPLQYMEAVVYKAGKTTVIPSPVRGYGWALAANNQGVVVGASSAGLFQWSESDGYQDLGPFDAEYATIIDVNDRSDILLELHDGDSHQFGETYFYHGSEVAIYRDGVVTPLPPSPFDLAWGSAINDRGAVAGAYATIPGVQSHAFVWDEVSGLRDLGQESEFSYATDVNNSGVVIGAYADAYQAPQTPFVFSADEGRRRLRDLIVRLNPIVDLESATHINDLGQIAGISMWGSDIWSRRVYIATPLPEPSTWAIAALASLCFSPWRRAGRFPSRVA